MGDSSHRCRLSFLVLLAAAQGAFAQTPPAERPPPTGPRAFDLSAFAGYQLNADVVLNGGELKIDDSITYGAALDYRLHRVVSVELLWEYTKTNQLFRSFNSRSVPSSRP